LGKPFLGKKVSPNPFSKTFEPELARLIQVVIEVRGEGDNPQ